MAGFGRFLAVALCAAAVLCAAAEPEDSWKAADVVDLIVRSGPAHSLVAPARAASEAMSFIQSEVSELVPEATVATKKKAPASKKAVVGKKMAKKVAAKAESKAVKKTKSTIEKVKAAIKKQAAGVKKMFGDQKVVAKVSRKTAIAAGANGPKVKTLAAKAKATAKSLTTTLHGAKKGPKKWTAKNVHLPKDYNGKINLPKNFHVPSQTQTKKKIWEATPPGIHTNKEYWKLKAVREEYKYKQGYEHMREHLLKKELRRHYASKLVRDHMRRKVDTMRRQRALDEYGPGADYKPFEWDEYDNDSGAVSKSIAKKVTKDAKATKKQEELHKNKKDMKDGKD